MSNVVQELIGFHGGVSQQSTSLRLPTQVSESNNCYHTIESGTRRRNPTNLVKTNTGISDINWTYSYDRGLTGVDNEKYSIIIDANGLKVLNLVNGDFMTVDDTSGTYLDIFTETGYSAVTVKDTTFITNRNQLVSTTTTKSSAQSEDAFVWVKLSDPIDGYDYKVTIDGNTFTSTGQLSTTAAANDLQTKIDAHASYSAVNDGNIIKVSGSITNINTSDNYGDKAIGFIYKAVPTQDDLPASMPYDAVIEITGLDNSSVSYWLESVNSRWNESVGPLVNIELDATTMPHQLNRLGNGTFTFGPVVWKDRQIGDNDNAKEPSYVGKSVTDLFFFKNRLGMLSSNSIVFSEVGEYYNFWKTTQVTTLDSDRIDLDIDAKKAIKLYYVEFLQNDIIIFGDRSQFKLEHKGSLTLETLSATLISEYDVNVSVRPLGIDNKVFFLALNGNYNTMYSYTKESLTDINQANNVALQIPKYIDNSVTQLVGSSVNGIVFLKSSTNNGVIYVYKYLEDASKLIQSAWSKWTFSGIIHSIFTTESKIHLLMTRQGLLSDVEWTLFNGIWTDNYHWDDTQYWDDSVGADVTSLENMEIYPQDILSDFLDAGNIVYTSTLKLSQYLPKRGNNTSISNKVNLKTIYIQADVESSFKLSILNTKRNIGRTIAEKYVLGRKPYIMGKAEDTDISIVSSIGNGFEINAVAYETRLNNRSKLI